MLSFAHSNRVSSDLQQSFAISDSDSNSSISSNDNKDSNKNHVKHINSNNNSIVTVQIAASIANKIILSSALH